jgi:signal transduction histidine kinase
MRHSAPAADADAAADILPSLRSLPLLAELPPEDLERMARLTARLHVPSGTVVMEEGTEGDGLYILVDGELEVTRREGASGILLAIQGPGTFLGEMSLIEKAPRNATVRALRPSELLVIPAAELNALLAASPAAALTILQTFASRLRSTEASLRQNAKLASLGTLAAGLAHELNNPASALSRSAAALMPAVDELDRCARRIGQLGLGPDLLARLQELGAGAPTDGEDVIEPSALNDAEDELIGWLDERGMERPVDLGPPLALCGWTPRRLESALLDFPVAAATPILAWLGARCAVMALADESRTAAGAVSAIVKAVKSNTYLGQAPVQSVDVAEGLESTLLLFRDRWSPRIRVLREYDPALPRIEAYGGELNQVWSNLVENAIQALDGEGTIQVRAGAGRDGVTVEVEDSGPGIPADVLPRIFDPFFTTKPFGSGTGLGLHVAYSVVRKHRGAISASSRPGRTVFTVHLPLRLAAPGT